MSSIQKPFLGLIITLFILPSLSLEGSTLGSQHTARIGPNTIAGHRIINILTQDNSPIRRSFPGFRPGKLFQDGIGRYWIAPSLGGERIVASYEETAGRWTFFGEQQEWNKESLHYNSGALIPLDVRRIGESKDGQIWFAGRSVPSASSARKLFLSSFNGKQWHRQEFSANKEEGVNIGFFRDAIGTLWFWVGEEFRSYDGKKWSDPKTISDSLKHMSLFKNTVKGEPAMYWKKNAYNILDAIQDHDGDWWIGTVSGVLQYDKQRGEWKSFSEAKQNQHIYEDKLGRIWFADWDEVSVYDKAKNSVTMFRLVDHLATDLCAGSFPGLTCLFQDKRGQMLFGHGCGLLCYSEAAAKWQLIDLTDIGLENEVEDIIEDRLGRIWVSTGSGIVILEP